MARDGNADIASYMCITSQNAIYVFLDPSGNSEARSDLRNSLRKINLGKKLI